MIGYHAVPVIADAYMKGIRGYDADEALQAMVASASYGPYDGIAQYMQLGYVPIDEEGEAASKTLEYAFDDWTIARMAEAMGRKDVAAQFDKRAAQLAQRLRRRTPASCARASATAASANPSTPPPAATAPTTPKATPGSTRGTCRRTSPAWPLHTAARTSCSPSSTRCSTPRSTRRSSSTWKTSPA